LQQTIRLDYEPQSRQRLLHASLARQIFYGGAAGGGKSHSLRWDAIGFCLSNPGLDAFIFRRTLPELEANHIRKIKAEIPTELGSYNDTKKRFEFYNGAGINLAYCEKEDDVTRYQGAEIHWLGIDEAAHLTAFQINYLRTRVRLGRYKPAEACKHLLPRVVLCSNPGGPGHSFLKKTMIDPAPAETLFWDKTMSDPSDPESKGWATVYIPARMQDNSYLDKGYAGQFSGLPPELAKQLREGDWDAVVGQALFNLSRDRHMLRAFTPPKHWTRFMVIDWGVVRPFSIGWYCVSEGVELAAKGNWPSRWLPAGALIRYAEWYGWNGRPNEGLRLSPQEVGKGIIKRELERMGERMDYRVGDTEMWADRGGTCVAETLFQTDPRLVMRKAKKDRKRNYNEVISRLAGNDRYLETGESFNDPMFFVTADCTQFWRTCPTLLLDEIDGEKGPGDKPSDENHVYDEVAYALRSRPFVTTEEDRWLAENHEDMKRARGKTEDPYALS